MVDSLFERMSTIARAGAIVQPADSMYARRSKIEPPADAGDHRGWAIWYDAGDFEHGICYRETKWRAQSPAGDQIEPPLGRVGDLAWLKAEIDQREDR